MISYSVGSSFQSCLLWLDLVVPVTIQLYGAFRIFKRVLKRRWGRR
jgi:hypothetical protein